MDSVFRAILVAIVFSFGFVCENERLKFHSNAIEKKGNNRGISQNGPKQSAENQMNYARDKILPAKKNHFRYSNIKNNLVR